MGDNNHLALRLTVQVSQLRLGLLRLLCGLEEDSELVLGLAARVWSGCLTWSSAFSALGLSSLALSALLEAESLAGLVSEVCSRGVSWFMPPQIEWKLNCGVFDRDPRR